MIHVHGLMGNFLVGTLRFLPGPLARAGFPVLVVQTRMGNVGQLFGQAIFEDALHDLHAGRVFLADRGFDHVVVSGYSSGASLAARYVVARRPPGMRGLVLLNAPWGLPQAAQRRSVRWASYPSYEQLSAEARASAENPAADRLFVVVRASGPGTTPRESEVYTYRTWWHARGPEAVGAMTYRQISQVRAPILLVQGSADEMVEPNEAENLAAVARRAGNDHVTVAPIEGAGHMFVDRDVPTIAAVTRWLSEVA
jgi:pimeloyl-ACP methyl ester carboxylesterase